MITRSLPPAGHAIACLLLAIGLTGCANEMHYNDLVGMVLSSGLVDPGSGSVWFRVKDKKDEPISGVAFNVQSDTAPLTVRSDERGVVRFPVRQVYLDENPVVRWRTGKRHTLSFSMTATLRTAAEERVYVSLDGKEIRGNDQAVVLFDSALEGRVMPDVWRRLGEQRRIVHQVTGLDPVRWGVVILEQQKDGVSYIVGQQPDLPTVWSYSLADVESESFDRTNAHEWLESTLSERLDLHDADEQGRNRIIVDGLSELASFDAGGFGEGGVNGLVALLQKAPDVVDLTRSFRSVRLSMSEVDDDVLDRAREQDSDSAAGYPLSFVFWHRLRAEHGVDLPRRFIAALQRSDHRDFDSAMRLLEQLTGERDLVKRLKHVDVKAAIAYLRDLARDEATP